MKLLLRHQFACDVDTFWRMYWDDAFDRMGMEGSDVQRELIESRDDGPVNLRRVRFVPKRELPSPVARLIGSKKLVYEQENRFNRDTKVVTWKVLPTVLPGKLTASGTMRVKPTSKGVERVVDGDIVVNVRFIGSKIEKAVVEQVGAVYEKNAEVCRRWLAQYA